MDIGAFPSPQVRRRALAGLIVAVAAVAAAWTGLIDVFGSKVDRDDLERAGVRALLSEGVSAADVSCPGDLEERTGATIECTYTDLISMTVGAAVRPEDPPPPRVGRVEIRIRHIRRQGSGTSSSLSSTPEFEARVLDPAR